MWQDQVWDGNRNRKLYLTREVEKKKKSNQIFFYFDDRFNGFQMQESMALLVLVLYLFLLIYSYNCYNQKMG